MPSTKKHPCQWGWRERGSSFTDMRGTCPTLVGEGTTYCELHHSIKMEQVRGLHPTRQQSILADEIARLREEITKRIAAQ